MLEVSESDSWLVKAKIQLREHFVKAAMGDQYNIRAEVKMMKRERGVRLDQIQNRGLASSWPLLAAFCHALPPLLPPKTNIGTNAAETSHKYATTGTNRPWIIQLYSSQGEGGDMQMDE